MKIHTSHWEIKAFITLIDYSKMLTKLNFIINKNCCIIDENNFTIYPNLPMIRKLQTVPVEVETMKQRSVFKRSIFNYCKQLKTIVLNIRTRCTKVHLIRYI